MTYLLTNEIAGSQAALFASALMAIVPAYISRSVAGSFDNEGFFFFHTIFFFHFLFKKNDYL